MFSINENYNDINIDTKSLSLDKIAIFALEKVCRYNDACASINFVTKEEIHSLNKHYRSIDKETDVLSFESDYQEEQYKNEAFVDLGDIFICLDVAKENAQKFNTSIESELKLLTVHGILHLCGYDHIDEKDAIVMESLEEEILDGWEKQKI